MLEVLKRRRYAITSSSCLLVLHNYAYKSLPSPSSVLWCNLANGRTSSSIFRSMFYFAPQSHLPVICRSGNLPASAQKIANTLFRIFLQFGSVEASCSLCYLWENVSLSLACKEWRTKGVSSLDFARREGGALGDGEREGGAARYEQ